MLIYFQKKDNIHPCKLRSEFPPFSTRLPLPNLISVTKSDKFPSFLSLFPLTYLAGQTPGQGDGQRRNESVGDSTEGTDAN